MYNMLSRLREGKRLAYSSHDVVIIFVYIVSLPDNPFQPANLLPHNPLKQADTWKESLKSKDFDSSK